jgi:hypothetical protein
MKVIATNGYKKSTNKKITASAIPVGAGLLAMDAPRLTRPHALSLTTIASKPAPTACKTQKKRPEPVGAF